MQTLPQELLDTVIDELANLEGLKKLRGLKKLEGLKKLKSLESPDNRPTRRIASYSLVSSAWVPRTRKHAFEFISFYGPEELKKWCKLIEPGPAGVSQHARYLVLSDINTLAGTETHIRAFTRVEWMQIRWCNFLLSPSVVECFTPMGSLAELEIGRSPTTSRVITSILAALPRLERFAIQDSKTTGDTDGMNLPLPRIPFFEGGNSLEVYSNPGRPDPPGPLDWVPPSARFYHLGISARYFPHEAVPTNRWLSSSYTTLTSLLILGDPYSLIPDQFTSLDLSPCRALAELGVSVGLHMPGLIFDTVLPSIASSQLSVISLDWDGTFEKEFPTVDYPAWEVAEGHLLRFAKCFSAGNPGKKMVVTISYYNEYLKEYFAPQIEFKDVLSRLKEEAVFSA